MSHIETMRLALKALEVYWAKAEHRRTREDERQAEDAITAIKAALEAKDEPVVWNEGVPAMLPKQKEGETFIVSYEPKLEVKDEPVAWISPTELLVMRGNALGGAKDWRVNVGLKPEDGDVGLYTTPPQRKPLTDEEIADAVRDADFDWHYGWTLDDEEPNRFTKFARAIEAKLKEKNT